MKSTSILTELGLESLLMTLTVSMFVGCAPRVVSDMFTDHLGSITRIYDAAGTEIFCFTNRVAKSSQDTYYSQYREKVKTKDQKRICLTCKQQTRPAKVYGPRLSLFYCPIAVIRQLLFSVHLLWLC